MSNYVALRIAEIMADRASMPPSRDIPYVKKSTSPKTGYVYFLKTGNEVKIGFSVNPRERLHSLQTGCARPAKMVKIVKGTPTTERAFHKRFAEYHLKGEWFDLRGRLAKYLEQCVDPVAFPKPTEKLPVDDEERIIAL